MLAIIPVSSPHAAKRRLEPRLDRNQRAELVSAMLADVVDACKRSRVIEDIVIVTPDPFSVQTRWRTLTDEGKGHAAAVAQALAGCSAAGAVVLMADCPLVRPETIDELCRAARPVALCPAQDGGTNALALRPPDAVEPAFGVPGSAEVVLRRARAAGLEPVVVDDPLVALDVDVPADLERILELGRGTRTHAVLDRVLAVSAECASGAR